MSIFFMWNDTLIVKKKGAGQCGAFSSSKNEIPHGEIILLNDRWIHLSVPRSAYQARRGDAAHCRAQGVATPHGTASAVLASV